jgi:acetyl esterase/lipase
MSADGTVSRRAYLVALGASAGLAGCTGDEATGDGSAGGATTTSPPAREGPTLPDPSAPLADRYEVTRERATYRESPDGPLSVEAALPDVSGPAPTLVHVHGGAWRYGSPGMGGMDRLAGAGFAVASIEYRLSETATYPAAVRDVVAALQWVHANDPGWNVDPDRVALVGGSAGAHLASLVAGAPDHPPFQPATGAGETAPVDALVGHYGIYDLRSRDACANRNTAALFGDDCDDPDVVAEASPVTHVDGDNPPTRLFHGSDDQLVPASSSRNYRDALAEAGVPVRYDELDGGRHGYTDPNNESMVETRREANRLTVEWLVETVWS